MFYQTHKLLAIMAVMLLAVTGCSKPIDNEPTKFEDNAIKLGEAQITVHLHADKSIDPEAIEMGVNWYPLLDNAMTARRWAEPIPVILERSDNSTWTGKIPMEVLTKENNQLTIKRKGERSGSYLTVGLNQQRPLTLDITLNTDGQITDVAHSGGTGRIDRSGRLNSFIMDLGHTSEPTKEIYEDCFKFRDWEMDSNLRQSIAQVTGGLNVDSDEARWIDNELTHFYMSKTLLGYEEMAKTLGAMYYDVDTTAISAPPADYYTFLNQVNFSPMILDELYPNLRAITNAILNQIPVGIEPIADTDIAEWQQDTKEKLSKVIDNPTDLLMDLLTATAYFEQIQTHQTPLTEVQKSNIRQHYADNDLGTIILLRNQEPYPSLFILD